MPKEEVTPIIDETMGDKLTRFKDDVSKDFDVLAEQRDKANEDMRFVNVDGGQWEGFLNDVYESRAKLEFDIVSGPKNRFVGEWNQNRLGVEYKPDDGSTSDDDAELLSSIYRADFRDFSGKLSVDHAVDEVATCGFGAYQIMPQFEDEEAPENDHQRITWEPIYNAYNAVAFDQSAKRIDKQDARHVTVLETYTEASFKAQWPDAEPTSAYTPSDRKDQNYTNSQETIHVATRREVVKKRETVFVYNNLSSGKVEVYDKEEHELVKAELKSSDIHKFVRERKIVRRRVEMSVFTGTEFLEEPRRIAGKWLGVVPVYGFRSYVDGSERYSGLVRRLKDAQRAFNVQMSQVVENAATAEQSVPIFHRSQMESNAVRQSWGNSRDAAYMIVDEAEDKNGNTIAAGPIAYTQPSQLDPNTSLLLQVIPDYVQGETGGAPQDTLDPNASGKAINALIKRENLNTQIINDNIANAIAYSGKVYQSMAEEIYDTPRIIRTLGKDGTDGKTALFESVLDENTGKVEQINALKGKKFRAYADVGPQYETMREQTVEELKGMLEALSQTEAGAKYTPAVITTILENVSGVGLGPLKKMVRQDMLLMGLVDPESDEDKEFLAQAERPQENPQQELIEAAAEQQRAEARNLDSNSLENAANAQLKQAQTQKTLSEIETDRMKTLAQVRAETFKNLQQISQGPRLQ